MRGSGRAYHSAPDARPVRHPEVTAAAWPPRGDGQRDALIRSSQAFGTSHEPTLCKTTTVSRHGEISDLHENPTSLPDSYRFGTLAGCITCFAVACSCAVTTL